MRVEPQLNTASKVMNRKRGWEETQKPASKGVGLDMVKWGRKYDG